jgi:hydroxymethylbilane synthase
VTTSALTGVVRVGTRRSALAMAQATGVAAALRERGCEIELVGVTTDGDRSAAAGAALADAGGMGVFVAELRQRLLDRSVDVVVHSLKDLPTRPTDGLVVAAVPVREDPRDALVTRDGRLFAELAPGATVGTGSPRRAAQLLAVRPDLSVRPIRGNVDTRLGKLAAGEYDAIVVAAAGLARLGRLSEASEVLSPDLVLPAPGQGALAVECRAGDGETTGPDAALRALLAEFDDAPTRAAVTAERALLAELEAGCTAPVGALASVAGAHDLHLVAAVVSVDGTAAIRSSASARTGDAEALGRRLATELLAAGAKDLIGAQR